MLHMNYFIKIHKLLEEDYNDFESQENAEKSSCVLGSELFDSKFDGLLSLVLRNNLYMCG